MSNYKEMIDHIASFTHRNNVDHRYSIAAAVAQSIRHYHRREFTFNWKEADLDLTVNVDDYEVETDPAGVDASKLPYGFLKIKALYPPGYPDGKLWPKSPDDFRKYHFETNGEPKVYTWIAGKLRVAPVPDATETHTLEYIKDIGTPHVYLDPDDGTTKFEVDGSAVTDAYTNAWFDEAFDLIAARAQYILWMGEFASLKRANLAKVMEKEALRELQGFDSPLAEAGGPQPWGL